MSHRATHSNLYLWENPEIPNKYMCAYVYDRSPERLQFSNGEYLQDKNITGIPIFTVKVNQAQLKRFDCLSNNASCPIVNERVVEILQSMAPNDVEFFETRIECPDGVLTHYRLVNITHAVEGIDRERSLYNILELSGKIMNYRKPIYKPNCLGQHLLARDKDFRGNLLVSQAIYDRFIAERLTGLLLITPHDLYKALYPRYYLED